MLFHKQLLCTCHRSYCFLLIISQQLLRYVSFFIHSLQIRKLERSYITYLKFNSHCEPEPEFKLTSSASRASIFIQYTVILFS